MSPKSKNLDALQSRLGYRFANVEFLERALTHTSAISPSKRTENSYQRLEFLGDRVLGLSVADMLNHRLPNANEGELSRALNALVRKETCAEIAMQLDLGADLRLGESEARSGGAQKMAILADVCEAIIGAIYCDGGFAKAFKFVERTFGARVDPASARRADSKTALQEWAQGRGLEPPTYSEVERTGPDHAPAFVVSVEIVGYARAASDGRSKKIAEHRAAEVFLLREKIWQVEK
jgi:ribonuclease III